MIRCATISRGLTEKVSITPKYTVSIPALAISRSASIAEATAEIVELANALTGRIFGHFMARAAELNLSAAEAKALQHLEPDRAMPMRELGARLLADHPARRGLTPAQQRQLLELLRRFT
jgi:hypothetical protein